MNKKLYQSKKMKKICAISIIVLLLIQFCTLITPKLMQVIIDDFIPNKNIHQITIGIILFVTIPCIYTIIQSVYTYYCYKIARNEGSEISIRIMRNLIDQDMSFFDKQNSVELATYSNKESYSYVFFYVWDIPQYYVSILSAIVIFILMFIESPIVGLLQITFIPVVLIPMKLFGKMATNFIEDYLKVNAEITQTRTDVFQNVKFIKLNRLEDRKIKEIEIKNNSVVGIWGKICALDSLRGVWSSGFVTMLYKGLTFGLCAYLIFSNSKYSISIGTLISLITYAGLFYSNLDQVFRSNIEEMKQNADYEKLFSYLDLEGESLEFSKLKDVINPYAIKINNLNFKHENSDSNIHVDQLNVNRGEWIGIVGSSGIGKSTVFDLIEKIYKLEEDSIYLGEQPISKINGFSIREKMTRVSQDVTIFPGTIRENMHLICPNASDERIFEVLKVACLDSYVLSLENGLDTIIGEDGKLMSGGEKQRLALAQGLLRCKNILLLDEITSNLDNDIEEKIADNLNEYRKIYNLTILSISHRKNFLKYVDRIYDFSLN